MAKTLPKPVVAAIELAIHTAHNNGKHPDLEAIAAIFNTTYKSVCCIRKRLLNFARTGIDPRKRPGPKPLKGQNDTQVATFIRNLLERRPDFDQKKISQACEEEFGVKIGQSTISRLMKRNGIPHKQSNRLYKKTKLVSTNPEGKVMPLPVVADVEGQSGREIAASALSQLPLAQGNYRSPYHQPAAAGSAMSVDRPPTTPAANSNYHSPYS
jgi:transposase